MIIEFQFEGSDVTAKELSDLIGICSISPQGIHAAKWELTKELGEMLDGVMPKADLSGVVITIDFTEIDEAQFEVERSIPVKINIDADDDAVTMMAVDHLKNFLALRPHLLFNSLTQRESSYSTGPITELDFLKFLDVVKETTELEEAAASDHYLKFSFPPSYFNTIRQYTERKFGKWEDKEYDGPTTALTWDFQTESGRDTEIVLGRDSVEIRTEVGSVGDILNADVDRSFSELEEPEIAVLERSAAEASFNGNSKSTLIFPRQMSLPTIVNQFVEYRDKYERERFAVWKWHDWLLKKCKDTYGYDQEIVDKADEVVSAYWPFNSKDGKRVKDIYYWKHQIRFYFAKYEGIDYFSESNPVQGHLSFSRGRKINPESWRELFDSHKREDAATSFVAVVVFVVLLILLMFLLFGTDPEAWMHGVNAR